MTSKPRLPNGRLFALAIPNVPLAALSIPLVLYLPEFYSGALGLNLSLVGAVFMAVRLLDIGYDPLVGGMMDATRTRFGRFRPWMAAGVPVIVTGVAMLFLARPGVGGLYLGFWLLVTYMGWSTVWLAQQALAASQTDDYDERSRLFGWSQAAFQLGTVIVMLLPTLLPRRDDGGMTAMISTAWVVMILAPLAVLPAVLFVKEPRGADRPRARASLGDYLALFRNRAVRTLLAADLIIGLSAGVLASVLLIYLMRAKGFDRGQVGIVLVVEMAAGLLATPLLIAAARKVGKHRVFAGVALLNAVCVGLTAVVPNDLVLITILMSGVGVAYAGVMLLPRAMMADVGDEVRLQVGADRTALLFSILMGTWKVGQALSVGLAFIALDALGYSRTGGDPAQQSRAVTAIACGLPILFSVVAAVVALRYPLTAARHAEVRRQLGDA